MEDHCTVHYRGTLLDCAVQPGPVPCAGGFEFDSTKTLGRPAHFSPKVGGSFWVYALPGMVRGDHREFYVPYLLAYGANDDPSKRAKGVGPNATLIFGVELVGIKDKDPAPPEAAAKNSEL
eukprot:gnl/TRDRNA2_/TRDRNA2_165305_c4_seq2.p1 gnl/TRDRNA2_/TRDRNA2_165305_c4~~gnl/TRDRNA2_/TRDRNA2_165305_c4_seq2.p1  ORF type:complete len:121 (-),score=10.90 gnl/TRDRNA2_/TRDRNA2_165305_c4_seq2:13-375(-)